MIPCHSSFDIKDVIFLHRGGMSTGEFKERVKEEAIANAKIYESNFVQYEYLICSKAFENGYHVIKSDQGNYLHLIGIHTELTADDFLRSVYKESWKKVILIL